MNKEIISIFESYLRQAMDNNRKVYTKGFYYDYIKQVANPVAKELQLEENAETIAMMALAEIFLMAIGKETVKELHPELGPAIAFKEQFDFNRVLKTTIKNAMDFINTINDVPRIRKVENAINVGDGRFGLEGIAVSQKLNCLVTSFDPNLIVSSYGKFTAKPQEFLSDFTEGVGEGTSLKDTDIVTGNYPCDATEHMVRQCSEAEKPFILVPCFDCSGFSVNPTLSGTQFPLDGGTEKFKYLLKLNPDLKLASSKRTGENVLTNIKLPESAFTQPSDYFKLPEQNLNKGMTL